MLEVRCIQAADSNSLGCFTPLYQARWDAFNHEGEHSWIFYSPYTYSPFTLACSAEAKLELPISATRKPCCSPVRPGYCSPEQPITAQDQAGDANVYIFRPISHAPPSSPGSCERFWAWLMHLHHCLRCAPKLSPLVLKR